MVGEAGRRTPREVLQGGKQVRPEELSEAEHRGPPSSLCALRWRRVIRMMKGSSVWRQVLHESTRYQRPTLQVATVVEVLVNGLKVPTLVTS